MSAPIEFRCRRCRRLLTTVDKIPKRRTVTVPACTHHSGRLTVEQIRQAEEHNDPIPIPAHEVEMSVPRTTRGPIYVDPTPPLGHVEQTKHEPFIALDPGDFDVEAVPDWDNLPLNLGRLFIVLGPDD